ncbi:MAG: hypothetical protein M3Q07_26515 [Pseudobdellovibrionaceae bacterium]|nr:hypothetical protein [Pseudobdellovibrionaceae bacterium]
MFKALVKKSLLGMAGIGVVVSTSSAFAASTDCIYSITQFERDCTTPGISANSSGHFVYISVSPFSRYRLIDESNDDVVAEGQAGATGHRQTVFGLYSTYKLQVSGAPAGWGRMNNT